MCAISAQPRIRRAPESNTAGQVPAPWVINGWSGHQGARSWAHSTAASSLPGEGRCDVHTRALRATDPLATCAFADPATCVTTSRAPLCHVPDCSCLSPLLRHFSAASAREIRIPQPRQMLFLFVLRLSMHTSTWLSYLQGLRSSRGAPRPHGTAAFHANEAAMALLVRCGMDCRCAPWQSKCVDNATDGARARAQAPMRARMLTTCNFVGPGSGGTTGSTVRVRKAHIC